MRPLRYVSGALLAVLWVAPLRAQEATGAIRGRVTDATTQQPLSGVNLTVGSRRAVTLSEGQYVITSVLAGADTLRVRMLGYAPATRPVTVVAGQTLVVDVAMTAQAIGLSEIVVTGYGEQRAGDITGAVTSVSSDEFNPGRVITPQQLIASKSAGVQVVDANEPGARQSLRIRGATSFTASSDPLYVIDGVPMGWTGGGLSAGRDPLNFLNPADIENITVLRDASSAAIYGANAANGVVIITTRSRAGQQGRTGTRFEYSATMSASSITRRPDMLSAAQFRIVNESSAVWRNDSTQLKQLQNANTDWYGLITQSAVGQEHNLSLTSASENMFYRASLGYLNQDGIIQGTNVARLSLGMNYQGRFFDNRLDLTANVRGSRTMDQFTPGGVLSNAAQMGPTQLVNDTTRTGFYEWPGNRLQSADNPLAILGLVTDRGRTYRSIGTMQLAYRLPFLSSLRANLNLNYDVARAERAQFDPSYSHNQIRTSTFGRDYRRTDSELNTSLETYLNYVLAMGAASIDATAGYSYGQFHGEYPWYEGRGLSTDLLGGNGVVTAANTSNGYTVEENKLISFFGRVNANYADRYLVGLSLRRDGSSRFSPDNAWGPFPAVSVGWRLSEEPFLRGFAGFSDLKLRASYGRTGNQAFGNYLYLTTYTLGNNLAMVPFGNTFVPTLRPSAVDPNIKWEQTGATDIGLDFGFRNQRISGSLDWYTKNTSDLIFQVPVPAGTNYSNYVTTNIGSMRNRGVELSLNAQLMQGRHGHMGWTASLNVSKNANEITAINPRFSSFEIPTGAISGGVGSTIQILRAGYPINTFYVFQHIRGANGKPIYTDNNGLDPNGQLTGQPDGTINEQDLYVDVNGDGRINFNDRRPFHDPAPKWMIGLSSYHTYGRFELNFTLRAWLGNWVYNNVAANMGQYGELERGSPYNLHASVLETGFRSQQFYSDYYVEKASFLRMDNITLAYTFNYRGLPLRVFGTVQSAFTITGYSGVDPTAGLNGIDNNMYPRARTFTGGLSTRF